MGEEAEYSRQQRWQIETADYRDRLLAVVTASPNFSGAEIKHETRELVLFAVGGPTDEISALLREAPSTIRVVWREAPYIRAELSAEARRVMSEQRGRFNTGGPRHDGTGLQFTTTDAQLLTAENRQRTLATRYPVSIRYGGPVIPA